MHKKTMKSIKKFCLLAICLLFSLVVVSCGNNKVDFVEKLKLEDSYSGKEFLKDGIGEVELFSTVDGDTAWFKTGGVEIKIRFVSVDTPESTGQIEPWGKAASNFTSEILLKAKKIVLQAHDGVAAELDSTGTRYLAFVWYSLDGMSELRNLNLELVQEGFSKSKVTEGSLYQNEFNSAATQALENKLHVYSNEDDPDYDNGAGAELTIKEVYLNAEQYLGSRVNFEAVVTRKDGNYTYVENEVDGKKYGILVYLGYQAILHQCFKVGYKLRVHGFVQEYNGKYQISGCLYDPFEYGSTSDAYQKFVRVLEKNVEVTPTNITAAQLNGGEIAERTFVSIDNLKVTKITSSNQIVDDNFAKEMTLICTVGSSTVQIRVSELYIGGSPITESYFKNKTISNLKGIVDTYYGTYQIRLVSLDDVNF